MYFNNHKKCIVIVIIIFSFLGQACAPLVKEKINSESKINIPDYKLKLDLKARLENEAPVDLQARQDLSILLHSLRRVTNNFIATPLEIKLNKSWKILDEDTKIWISKHLEYFESLPASLQNKFVTDIYSQQSLNEPIDIAMGTAPEENAGAVCGRKSTEFCSDSLALGKLRIPQWGAQNPTFPPYGLGAINIALDPNRPILGIAIGTIGLLLIDISDPKQPKYFNIGNPFAANPYKSNSTGWANDVSAVTRGASTFMILTSTATPNQIFEDSVPEVERRPGQFEIVSIDNPTPYSPTLHGSITGSYLGLALTEDGQYAFSFNLNTKSIDIIDLSNLAFPQVVNSFSGFGDLVGVSEFSNGILPIGTGPNNSTVQYLRLDLSTGIPTLIWQGSEFIPGNRDINGTLIQDNRAFVVGDGFIRNNFIGRYGPTACSPEVGNSSHRYRYPAISNVGDLVIAQDHGSHILIPNSSIWSSCDFSTLEFYKIGNSCLENTEFFGDFSIPNTIGGLAVRGDKIYIADSQANLNCETISVDSLYFRIYSYPKTITSYENIEPSIESINGHPTYKLDDLPSARTGCRQQVRICNKDDMCGSTEICVQGICAQPPIITISDNQEIVLTGSNFWDLNAQVLINNSRFGGSWIPYDATVLGDEYCNLPDRIRVNLDAAVTSSGIKRLKIRNSNRQSKLRLCGNCDDLEDPICMPDYVESDEIIVYFQNEIDSNIPGYDLKVSKIKVLHGTGNSGDLDSFFGGDDETFLIAPTPDGNTIFAPDRPDINGDGFEFQNSPDERNIRILIASQENNQNEGHLTDPEVRLWESDNPGILAPLLVSFGTGCAGTDAITDICGGACAITCGSIAVIGILMVLFDGGKTIIKDVNLPLSKRLARDIIEFGECALIDEDWFNEFPSTVNVSFPGIGQVIGYSESDASYGYIGRTSISNIQVTGGIRWRSITKVYHSKNSDALYSISYKLSEKI
ncbi:MAG: hypothetical protein H6696_19480 [Deferribacteres bacterium]|nr:hypothetical protein [Deferribacteres bacterium]